MSHDEPIEALFARSAGRDGKRPLPRQAPRAPFSLSAAAADLREAKLRVEEDLDCVLDLHRTRGGEGHIDRVKNDNVMLFKTNQDLRLLVRELQRRLGTTCAPVADPAECDELRAKNSQLERSLADLRADFARVLCEAAECVPLARHRHALAELQARAGAAEEQLAFSRGRLAAAKEQLQQTSAQRCNEGAPTLEASSSPGFFFAHGDLLWEIERLRAELQRTNNTLGARDAALAELRAELARREKESENRGPVSRLNTAGLSEIEELRAENARLRDSVRGISSMNTKNRTEIDRLSALVANIGTHKV